jgi:hypothetical protein
MNAIDEIFWMINQLRINIDQRQILVFGNYLYGWQNSLFKDSSAQTRSIVKIGGLTSHICGLLASSWNSEINVL